MASLTLTCTHCADPVTLAVQEELLTHLPSLPVDALPGVGYHIAARLKQLDIHSCGDLQAVAKEVLQQHLGPKTGESLHNFCRGIDHRSSPS